MSLKPPKTLAMGRYELLARIGTDDMGEVWRVRDQKDGVARLVKFVSWGAAHAASSKRSFATEAQAQLDAPIPGAVKLLALAREGKFLYLIVDDPEALPLEAILRSGGALRPLDAVNIAESVLRALEAAHDRGLIQKTLSPRVVQLSTDGRVALSWFGLLGALDPGSAEEGKGLDPRWFRAPEQGDSGATPDVRWDVYAVGQMLAAMILGEAPREPGDTTDARIRAAMGEALAEVYRKATARDPAARYPTAGALRAALAEARPARSAGDSGPGWSDVVRTTSAGLRSREVPLGRGDRRWLGLAAALTVLLVGAALALQLGGSTPPPSATAAAPAEPSASPDEAAPAGAEPVADAASAQSRSSATATGASATSAPRPAREAAAPEGPTAELSLSTARGTATVYIDRKKVGKTPLTVTVPVDVRKVELVDQDGKRAVMAPHLTEGEHSSLCWDFEGDRPC